MIKKKKNYNRKLGKKQRVTESLGQAQYFACWGLLIGEAVCDWSK